MGWASDPTLFPWWVETKFVFERDEFGFHLWWSEKKFFGRVWRCEFYSTRCYGAVARLREFDNFLDLLTFSFDQ